VNGRPAALAAPGKDGAAYTYRLTVAEEEPLGPAEIQISGYDMAGNFGAAADDTALTIVEEVAPVPVAGWPGMLLLSAAGVWRVCRRKRR
jgi:hypothetical protein